MPPRKSGLTRARATKYNKRKHPTDQQTQGVGIEDATQECDIPPPKKKGRGPGTIRDATEVIVDRPEIWPVGMHEFSCGKDSRQITAAITRLALNYMPSPLRSYNAFDPHTKNNIEKAILERFRYREGEDADHCREVFDAIAVKRYAEELHTARDKCINKFGWDMPLWKANVPHWCLKAANWHGLCDIFNTEEWQGLRTQNKINRMSSGFKIAHHGGSASTLQHVDKLISSKSDIANLLFIPSHVETTLKKGTPTLEEIYLHMHCRLENGKSPVLSQYEAATEGVTETTEDGDTNDIVNQSTEETTTPSLTFDINSLQFTNDRAKKVYEDVTEWRADAVNVDKDDSALYITAVGGSIRGRIRGFGSVLDPKLPTATTRARATHAASSVSGVTQHGSQKTYTHEEMNAILVQERDQRLNEEREEMKRIQAENNIMFTKLFAMMGVQRPNLQGQGTTTIPQTQEGASRLTMAISQGLGADFIQSDGRGTFQALLNGQSGQEVETCEDAINQWFGGENQNNLVNQPF
ncbi:hypothetical protein FCM35_KLT10179 [Carex littledalei]|uniref:Uncharacterized protein n=1 Tax=Carex littledalei TaxID=544730 RepID=A0A833R9T6_9POAL|nr:hypothetical protein FCM35_KLT10179 [Carex littledalei]